MDPEVAKQLITVGGTLGGALVGAFASWLVARTNIGGQRAIARDNARRLRREKQVQALLDHIQRSIGIHRQLGQAQSTGQAAKFGELLAELRNESPFLDPIWTAVQDETFDAASKRYLSARGALEGRLVEIYESGKLPSKTEIDPLLLEHTKSALGLHKAAEWYIDRD
jgi:hypothetical protein